MTLWVVGTVGHFLLAARWLKRAGAAYSRDELWFQTMVVGLGTLSIALHLVASTTGLSIAGVLLVLLAGHAIAWWHVARHGSQGREAARDLVTRLLETAALVVLTAIVVQWTLLALTTAEISGTDAAHYHVPNAVNLALGASPFDLPATPHLYPMGSSTLAAWFILPVRTTLLTDLVMVLPFLLLVAAAGWVFRQLTSLSGLAWSTWMMLALFGTALFRSASLMSADLLFAAATMAFAAALLAPLLRRELTPTDIWLLALSLGLLLGSKTTGILVAALLGVPAVLTLAFLMFRGRSLRSSEAGPSGPAESPGLKTRPPSRTWVCAGAAAAVIGAGGIWLVRNWWTWGSPIAPNSVRLFGITLFAGAPYEATMYNSVLGDLTETTNYQLWNRAKHFIDLWLSPWYLPSLIALVLIPIDLVVTRRRGGTSSSRFWTMLVVCGTAAVLMWFLIGAPWTSLEWTRGSSLRYALPWLAMLPVVAWTGLFPSSLPWYRRSVPAFVTGLMIAIGALAILRSHPELPFPPLLTPGALIAQRRAQTATAVEHANHPRTIGERVYDAVIAFEATDPHSCDMTGRRFFVTGRFDEPSALQGARLTNRVFYAARDAHVTARVHPGMGPCDYIITHRPVMDTDKGAALHAGLNPSGTLVEVAAIEAVVLLVHR
ncbi:MAG TPA: hypothetical protein VMZ90_09350 [Vicinamibacterales bacterium]|nr:hypothetical protein [Vicinamibacterales bacterium]